MDGGGEEAGDAGDAASPPADAQIEASPDASGCQANAPVECPVGSGTFCASSQSCCQDPLAGTAASCKATAQCPSNYNERRLDCTSTSNCAPGLVCCLTAYNQMPATCTSSCDETSVYQKRLCSQSCDCAKDGGGVGMDGGPALTTTCSLDQPYSVKGVRACQ